jgi:hypothetical protein
MIRKAVRLATRANRQLLRLVYGFDAWHVGHAGEPYGADIVRRLNAWPEADRQAVVEIGCGCGDIVRRLRFRGRLGLDRDARVLSAAKLLARGQLGSAPRFDVFDCPDTPLAGEFNAIVMVNWIHELGPDRLRAAIHDYFAHHLKDGGGLVLDTVQDPAYTYNHDVQALAPAGAVIDHLGRYARRRDVWMLRKNRTPTNGAR